MEGGKELVNSPNPCLITHNFTYQDVTLINNLVLDIHRLLIIAFNNVRFRGGVGNLVIPYDSIDYLYSILNLTCIMTGYIKVQ
jgi:hypothetical protein